METELRIGQLVSWLAERGCWPQLQNQDADGPCGWVVYRTAGVCGSDPVCDVHATLLGALEQAYSELSDIDGDRDREYRAAAACYANGWLVHRPDDADRLRRHAEEALASGDAERARRNSDAAILLDASDGVGELFRRRDFVMEPIHIGDVPEEIRRDVLLLLGRGFSIEATEDA